MQVLHPEYYVDHKLWCVDCQGERLTAPSLRELTTKLPPSLCIGNYYPNGYLYSQPICPEMPSGHGRRRPSFLIKDRRCNKPSVQSQKENYNLVAMPAPRLPRQLPCKPILPERHWTPDEEEYLRDNYHSMAMSEIGYHLNRTRNSVAGKISRLKLSSKR